MNRRTFGKVLAGSVAAAAGPEAEGKRPGPTRQTATALRRTGSESWQFVILDSVPPHLTEIAGNVVADMDGDGKTEVIVAGDGALLWYKPSAQEKGVIATGHFGVGVAAEDIDGDGRKEVVAGKIDADKKWTLYWYKSGPDLHGPWAEHVLDLEVAGHPHDILFGDLDGDGRRELVSNAMYCAVPGLFAYKIPAHPTLAWPKQTVQSGHSAEGTAIADLNGDGKNEIVSGPYWYSVPAGGAFSGQPWAEHSLAPDYREMCRAAIIDVNGDGHPDVILVEDEFPDGRMAWFENRLATGQAWIQHPIDAPLNFAHSLRAWKDPKTQRVCILAGEMNEGGFQTPYNWDARLIQYTTEDGGKSWTSEMLYQGEGTHEAVRVDLDRSGKHVIFGHAAQIITTKPGEYTGWVQMFRPSTKPSLAASFRHSFVDRDKPYTGIDIHAVDIDGDGVPDIVCGAWWYKNPTWERRPIPGVAQIINAYDLDGDGRKELIGITAKPGGKGFYGALCSELVWLKPTDLSKDLWEIHRIGTGDGDWPHGNAIAPLLPGGRSALVCGYHDHRGSPPQIFEVPADPRQSPWEKRVIADVPYGEELVAYDLDGDGKLDIVAGPYWLENRGDGRFEPHLLIAPEQLKSLGLDMISRVAIADVNGDGRPDILFTVEAVDYKVRKAFWAPAGWMENTGNLRDGKFAVHIIDRVRSPHSLSAADLDGDGELEIVVGEHDPFHPYRSKSRLYAYKKADARGLTWSRYTIDDRFEHHDGAKVVQLGPGRQAIISHGWMDSAYVHVWEREST